MVWVGACARIKFMKLSKKDVERIAGLARIGLNEREKEKMAEELGSVLGYIDRLDQVNTNGTEPIAHITGLENVLRNDGISKKLLTKQAAEVEKLIKMGPDKKDNYVKVKAVFGE